MYSFSGFADVHMYRNPDTFMVSYVIDVDFCSGRYGKMKTSSPVTWSSKVIKKGMGSSRGLAGAELKLNVAKLL
jgi:hypothetical protein